MRAHTHSLSGACAVVHPAASFQGAQRCLHFPHHLFERESAAGTEPLQGSAGHKRRVSLRPRVGAAAQRARWPSRGSGAAMLACQEASGKGASEEEGGGGRRSKEEEEASGTGARLGLQDVRKFVEAENIPAEFLVVSRGRDADASALTALATADVLGCEEARIAKSILFLADGQPLLVVLSGNQTVDTRRLLQVPLATH